MLQRLARMRSAYPACALAVLNGLLRNWPSLVTNGRVNRSRMPSLIMTRYVAADIVRLNRWPSWGGDVPVYSGILKRWRDPNPQVLMPWLLAACDRHTQESRCDAEKNAHDFGDQSLTRTPIEILMIFRLRQLMGLANPVVDHPLMESPFDCLPETQPPFVPDELMQGTLKRARRLASIRSGYLD